MAKYGYLCFIRFTHEFLTSSDMSGAWRDKPKELAEEHGFEMHFGGSPWGTDDHAVLVFSSDKPLSDWSQFIGEWLGEGNIVGTRTVLVNIPE